MLLCGVCDAIAVILGPLWSECVQSAALVCPLLSYLTCSFSPIHCFDMTRFLARHSNSRFRWHFGRKGSLIGKNGSTMLTFRNRPHTHMHVCPVDSCVCTLTSTCGLTTANCNGCFVLFCFLLFICIFVLFCFCSSYHLFKAYGWTWVQKLGGVVPSLVEYVDEARIDGRSFNVAVIRKPMHHPPPVHSICALPPELLKIVGDCVCVSDLMAIHGYEDPTVLPDDAQEIKDEFFLGAYHDQYYTACFDHYWF